MRKIFVWDRSWAGAYIIVATSAEEAAVKWNARYPKGIRGRSEIIRATAESFEEHDLDDVVVTLGDD
jgi:hypothetical protein